MFDGQIIDGRHRAQACDPRSLRALDVAERYARGDAGDDELKAAREAASAAEAAVAAVAAERAWQADELRRLCAEIEARGVTR